MNKLLLLTALIGTLGMLSCKQESKLAPISRLQGTWEAIEFHYSLGGPEIYVDKLSSGHIVTFNQDNTFTSNILPDCDRGTFIDKNDIITLSYSCDNYQESIQYGYSILDQQLSLWAINPPTCFEECFFKYKHIEE